MINDIKRILKALEDGNYSSDRDAWLDVREVVNQYVEKEDAFDQMVELNAGTYTRTGESSRDYMHVAKMKSNRETAKLETITAALVRHNIVEDDVVVLYRKKGGQNGKA